MGLQQCTNQGWRSTESGLFNKQGTFRTNGDVLWSYQLPSHIPNNDEHYIRPRNSRAMVNGVHGRYGYTHSEARRRDRTTTHRMPSHIRSTHPYEATRT